MAQYWPLGYVTHVVLIIFVSVVTPEPNINLLSLIMLLGGVQGLFLAVLLLRLNKKNFAANRYLAMILAALGLTLLHQFLVDTGYIHRLPALLGFSMPLDLLYPPALYLYIRTMTQSNVVRRDVLVHFLLPFIGLLLLLPFFWFDFVTRLSIIERNYMVVELPGVLDVTFSSVMLAIGVLFTVYLVLSFKLLFLHAQNIKQFFSFRENITLSWLRNFLLVMVVFWVFMMLFYYVYLTETAAMGKHGATLFDWLWVFTVGAVFYMGTMGLLQRRIYRGAGTVQSTAVENAVLPEKPRVSTAGQAVKEQQSKYKNSALTKDMSLRLVKQLESLMQRERPYLKNNLTLPELAKLLNTSPNYLSQVINEQLKMNFFDYINLHRIGEAKKLLMDPPVHIHTVLDVAMASAFNSKSAFYTAFKKHIGITPAEFKKSHSL